MQDSVSIVATIIVSIMSSILCVILIGLITIIPNTALNQNNTPLNQNNTPVNQNNTSLNQNNPPLNQNNLPPNQNNPPLNQDNTPPNQNNQTPVVNNYCLTNNKNSDKYIYKLNETTKEFSTIIDSKEYNGSYSINNNSLSINSPSLLEQIKSKIPGICSKPNTIPNFRCTNTDCSNSTSEYDLGWLCGKVGLELREGNC